MYKRIHHHITEEHFDHPHAAHLAAEVAKYVPSPPLPITHDPNMRGIFQYPAPPFALQVTNNPNTLGIFQYPHANPVKAKIPLTPSAVNYVNAFIGAWTQLASDLRQYAISVAATGEDLTSLQNRINFDSGAIDTLLQPYYTPAQISAVGEARNTMFSAITAELSATKTNTANQMVKTATQTAINNYARAMNSVNPRNWTVDEIVKVWIDACASLNAQVQARVRKDWPTDLKLAGDFFKEIASSTGFANVVALGVIQQFPQKFTH